MNTMHTTLAAISLAAVIAAGSIPLLGQAQDAAAPRPPAPTLAPPATPSKAADANGFLQRWLVLEPIRASGQLTDSAVRAAITTAYFPISSPCCRAMATR